METNKKNFTEQDYDDAFEYFSALMAAVHKNAFKMSFKVQSFALACFLNKISEIAAQYGFDSDCYLDELAKLAKNKSKDPQTDK